ncbi:MAG: DUF6391 domain-containing protein [Anaerolineales bacterium]
MPIYFDQILNLPVLSRIRRNHGLEHATIHLLTASGNKRILVGRSDGDGFLLYGDTTTEEVKQAAYDALDRLRRGERHLAIHPNCGTNLLTAGMLSGMAAFLSLGGMRKQEGWSDRLFRLPGAIILTTLALILAQPLGTAAQRHLTTDGDPGELEIVEVRPMSISGQTIHRVRTSH